MDVHINPPNKLMQDHHLQPEWFDSKEDKAFEKRLGQASTGCLLAHNDWT